MPSDWLADMAADEFLSCVSKASRLPTLGTPTAARWARACAAPASVAALPKTLPARAIDQRTPW